MTRHSLDAVSLVFGILFATIGLTTLALGAELPLAWIDLRVVLPSVAVGAGLWLLVSASRRSRLAEAAGAAEPDRSPED
jgi:hypothetical protein